MTTQSPLGWLTLLPVSVSHTEFTGLNTILKSSRERGPPVGTLVGQVPEQVVAFKKVWEL